MKKLTIIILVLIGAFLLLISYVSRGQEHPDSDPGQVRPNIVWITVEDMSPHLSSFGETAIRTPNLDQLAKEGVRYTRVFTVAGVCAPSRNGIITGMYPQSIGGDNMRNYMKASRDSERVTSRVLPSYSIVPPPYVKCFTEYLRKEYYYCTNSPKEDYQFEAPVTSWDESGPGAHWKNRPGGQPFFAVFNIGITHESQIWLRDSLPMEVDPAQIRVPPIYPDNPDTRRAIARHLSNVVAMDRQVGKIIQELKDAGLYENSFIFFFSDHGDGLPYVKREITKRGLHVPLIVKFPGAEHAGKKDERLISGIDFGPTVLSLAGVQIPAYMHGQAFLGAQKKSPRKYIFASRDRMDEKVDRVRSVFDGRFQYLKNYMPELPYYQDLSYRRQIPMMTKMLELRDQGKLNRIQMRWFNNKPPEELYDTEKDPYQLNNLISDPGSASKLAELKSVFEKWMKEVGDLHELPEVELRNKMWGNTEKAPVTAMPQLSRENGVFFIRCTTPGASIGYIVKTSNSKRVKEDRWLVYNHGPLLLNDGDRIIVRAHRIGYSAAETEFDIGNASLH